jgi:hypothetical protein
MPLRADNLAKNFHFHPEVLNTNFKVFNFKPVFQLFYTEFVCVQKSLIILAYFIPQRLWTGYLN